MPTPNLYHAVSVTIKPLDKDNTVYDNRTRQPVKHVKRASSVVIDAQVQWTDLNRGEASAGGLIMNSRGYLVFRKTDLANASYAPGHGDKITTIGTSLTSLELYVTDLEPAGHYDGDYTLIIANFEDRRPGKGSV